MRGERGVCARIAHHAREGKIMGGGGGLCVRWRGEDILERKVGVVSSSSEREEEEEEEPQQRKNKPNGVCSPHSNSAFDYFFLFLLVLNERRREGEREGSCGASKNGCLCLVGRC